MSAATVPAATLGPTSTPAAAPLPRAVTAGLRAELADWHRDRPRASRTAASTRPADAATSSMPVAYPRHRATAHPTARVGAAPVRVHGPIGEVLAYALAQVGHGYRFGAAGPGAFDCSGLAMAAFARIGVRLPHNAAAMLGYGRPVGRDQLTPGDLVFPDAGHVQIYLGAGLVVEAANPRAGVRVAALWGFWTARRLT